MMKAREEIQAGQATLAEINLVAGLNPARSIEGQV